VTVDLIIKPFLKRNRKVFLLASRSVREPIAGKHIGDRHLKRRSDSLDIHDADIAFAPFDARYVRSVHSCSMCQHFLGYSASSAKLPNPLTKLCSYIHEV